MLTTNYTYPILCEGQGFIIEGQKYVVSETRKKPNLSEMEIEYLFKRYPDTKGESWTMLHQRIDNLQEQGRIKFFSIKQIQKRKAA